MASDIDIHGFITLLLKIPTSSIIFFKHVLKNKTSKGIIVTLSKIKMLNPTQLFVAESKEACNVQLKLY